MVSRLAAAGLTTTLPEVAPVKVPLAKLSVIVSATLYDRLVKVIRPLTAVRLVVPCKAALPPARLAVTTVLLSLVRRLPNWSSIRITGCWAKATPAVAVGDGWVRIVSLVAAAGR